MSLRAIPASNNERRIAGNVRHVADRGLHDRCVVDRCDSQLATALSVEALKFAVTVMKRPPRRRVLRAVLVRYRTKYRLLIARRASADRQAARARVVGRCCGRRRSLQPSATGRTVGSRFEIDRDR